MASTMQLVYGGVIVIIYAAIAIGRVPFTRMNRAGIALAGAAVLVAIGALSEHAALEAIDTGTIILLGAMMILNANLRMAGFFRLVAGRALAIARTPAALLALVIAVSGVLSALFLNDTICLMFTPLLVDLALRLRRNPVPYLIGLATAANVGSTATITGNPQNIVIGQVSGIGYLDFALALTPIALIGLAICWGVIVLLYRDEFRTPLASVEMPDPHPYPPLMWRTLLVVAGLLIAFLAGVPTVAAAGGAAALLLISRVRPAKLFDLDWTLLVFFAGLFMVTGAIEVTGLSARFFDLVRPAVDGGVATFSLAVAGLSNLVSNVPAVLLFRPIIPTLPDPRDGWLTLAMASTLAGNLTLLGSVANLIVAELAAERGVRLSFMAYLRAGVPITLLTLLVGVLWLMLT